MKLFTLVSCLCLFYRDGLQPVEALRQKPRFMQKTIQKTMQKAMTVRKPVTDNRQYKYSTLDSGLSVLVIEDPKAAKSGFSVAVSAGSFYDPPTLPGLAHFCEHLLFLGTKKYPDESSFDTFLTQHDGSNNAYTEQEKTVFYNEVSHAGFEEGLDRFAQFFIAPLFKQEMVGRELEAVNSEHLKNVPDQGRRLWELMRSNARNGSVVGHFYTGTMESLKHGDAETVAALKKYHEENYCAPRMRLVMLSNRSVSAQLELAKKHFDAVPRGRGVCSPEPRDFANDEPFRDTATLGHFIQFRTDSVPQLWMMFPLPPTLKKYQAQPATVLSYLMAYAGPHSLKSQLKANDIVSDLGVQVDQSSAATLIFFMFDLTPTGVKNVEQLTSTVFQYFSQLHASSQTWLSNVYPTLQQMSFVTFDYQDAPDSIMDTMSSLSGSMLAYSPEDTLAGDTTIDRMDVELMQELFSYLKPENLNMGLATKEFDEAKANRVNKWYGVHYADTPVPAAMREAWKLPGDVVKLHLPPPLKYVPSNLTMLTASAGEQPKQMDSSRGVEVWWLGRGIFPMPKVQLRIKLSVPKELFGSANFVAMRQLHVELANLLLEEPMEDFSACGMQWELTDLSDGYHITMSGFSSHLTALVAEVVKGLAQPGNDASRLAQVQQKLVDQLEDTTSKMPYEHAMEALAAISTDGSFSRLEMLAALKAANSQTLKQYLDKLNSKSLRIQLLTTGNLDEAIAAELGDTVANSLGPNGKHSLSKEQAAERRVLKANDGIEVRIPNPIPQDANSAVINAYQYGVPDVSERVKLLMLGKMISQPVYDTLRTKEQLGYVVFGLVMPHLSTLELRVIVQGAKATPDEVDDRIEAVLDDFGHSLHNLTLSEFNKWKTSLRSTIDRQDQNMAQEADRFWAQIVTDELCFTRKQMALEYLASLTSPEEVAVLFDQFRGKPKKISVRLFGTQAAELLNKTTSSGEMSLVLKSDSQADKKSAENGRTFFPTAGICHIHKAQ